MPAKQRPPAPIDRPLSKAYLREFSGWSTAFPPGLSEPNSLRVMENVLVTREGAARVRPGLRSYLRTKSPLPIVGSHELFYTPYGKAYLVAVRETVDVGTADEREIVGFRVIGPNATGAIAMGTLASFGFSVPSGANVLAFTEATTYVKYLQIDNKIFALSNAPEGMLMFWVGSEKKAKKLQSITRPAWSTTDKLTAMQPTSAWVSGNLPSAIRTNLCTTPDYPGLHPEWWTTASKATLVAPSILDALVITSRPVRTNYAVSPLHNVAAFGADGWIGYFGSLSVSGVSLRITKTDSTRGYTYAGTDWLEVPQGQRMRVAFDLVSANWVSRLWSRIMFYRSNGDFISSLNVMSSTTLSASRRVTDAFIIPTQAKYVRVQIGLDSTTLAASSWVNFNNVALVLDSENNTSALDGNDGADYFWEGAVNASRSVYHTGRDIWVDSPKEPVTPGVYTVSANLRGPANTNRIPLSSQLEIEARALNASGAVTQVQRTLQTGDWPTGIRIWTEITVPAGSNRLQVRVTLRDARRGDLLSTREVMIERAVAGGPYFSGNTGHGGATQRRWAGTPNASISIEEVFNAVLPAPQVPADGTLVSSNQTKNRYSFSFFYTISNELGESAASQVTTIKAQRPWTAWAWLTPAGVNTDDPRLCHDQFTTTMPLEVFTNAVASGATKWTAYYFVQGPNDAPSVTALRFAEIDLTNDPEHKQHGYARLTPQMVKLGIGDPLVPSQTTLVNASDPLKGSQGIVAADRLILVGNPADPARITWSSGAPGDYHNFSTLLGGGTKQLTSGNLYTTATVKLWQNPQSVDNLTILNNGDDGRSNAYYMQPANITSLSESISVMGFEEVTGLMGTVSPYGCEVVNSALYRPLFHGLFKSTANNYTLSTKPVSDSIQNVWRTLQSLHRIVSAQLDSRIYFLVHNISGEALKANCRGNEVWVIDLASTTPTWSRWTVQGVSLRAMDIDNKVMMSIVRPDGIFVFNEDRYSDEVFNESTGVLEEARIKWYLETNIQGANRAHDAWCNLQQVNVAVGSFIGQLRYGIRGKDVNGMDILVEKVLLSSNPPPELVPYWYEGLDGYISYVIPTLRPTQREDYLLVRKIMKEWAFFAGSVDDTVGDVVVPRFSGGQVSSVQYRYMPATVNVGYEYGSIETFEYGGSAAAAATTDSGTPKPYVDMSRA